MAAFKHARFLDDLRDLVLTPVGHHMHTRDPLNFSYLLDNLYANAFAFGSFLIFGCFAKALNNFIRDEYSRHFGAHKFGRTL